MAAKVCATCLGEGEWHTLVGSFAICATCGETLVLGADGTRKAMGIDVDRLHHDDVKILKAGLTAWRRAHRPDRFSDTPKPLPDRIH